MIWCLPDGVGRLLVQVFADFVHQIEVRQQRGKNVAIQSAEQGGDCSDSVLGSTEL
jgi:hypothetical protein